MYLKARIIVGFTLGAKLQELDVHCEPLQF